MRKLDIRPRFRTDVRRLKRQRQTIDWETMEFVLEELIAGENVPAPLKPHALRDEWAGFSEFHLEVDMLVIYRLTDAWVQLHRLGTHRDLFSRSRA